MDSLFILHAINLEHHNYNNIMEPWPHIITTIRFGFEHDNTVNIQYCVAVFQVDADLVVLQEMFPGIPKGVIRDMRVRDNIPMEDIIDTLLEQEEVPNTLKPILKRHSEKVIDQSDENIVVARSCIYHKAKIFYKSAINNPNELKKSITIVFPGEEGADVGALRNEFLIETLRNIGNELFEGQNERLVPKSHWGCESNFQLVGAIIAHSVLQSGPAFPCIHPAIYARIAGKYSELSVDELPNVDDIPCHAGTLDLLEFIDKVCQYEKLHKALICNVLTRPCKDTPS